MKETQQAVTEKNDFDTLSNSKLHPIVGTFQLSFLKKKKISKIGPTTMNLYVIMSQLSP